MKEAPGPDTHGVLPIWNSDVSRCNALADFEKHFQDLFQEENWGSPMADLVEFIHTPRDLW